MPRFNDHDPRSAEYRMQAIDNAAQQDAASYRVKNEREQCYSEEAIADLAQTHAGLRYMHYNSEKDGVELEPTRTLYQSIFRAIVRRGDQGE